MEYGSIECRWLGKGIPNGFPKQAPHDFSCGSGLKERTTRIHRHHHQTRRIVCLQSDVFPLCGTESLPSPSKPSKHHHAHRKVKHPEERNGHMQKNPLLLGKRLQNVLAYRPRESLPEFQHFHQYFQESDGMQNQCDLALFPALPELKIQDEIDLKNQRATRFGGQSLFRPQRQEPTTCCLGVLL